MAEFQDYMEQLKLAEAEREHMDQMIKEHEIWRQTTWSGWFVRQLQIVGVHVMQFVSSVANSIRYEQNKNTVMGYILLLILRIIGIAVSIGAFYMLIAIFNHFVSKEITIVEEIIIDDTDFTTNNNTITQQQKQQLTNNNAVTKKQARRSKTKHS